MLETLDEFEGLYEEDQDDTYYENKSKEYINIYQRFVHDKEKTYQGISIENIDTCIRIGETKLIPWEHITLDIDYNHIKTVGKSVVEELIIPDFVEELISTNNDTVNQIARTKIKYISIPSSVLAINNYTFQYYKNLSDVDFQEDSRLIYLGSMVFYDCEKLHKLNLHNCKELNSDEISSYNLGCTDNIKIKW